MTNDSEIHDIRVEELDTRFYRDYHPDLSKMSDDEARSHYLSYGASEGRFASASSLIGFIERGQGRLPEDFDPLLYIALNADLRDLNILWEAQLHYLEKGRKQQRPYRIEDRIDYEIETGVDAAFYKSYYTDLNDLTDQEAIVHFEQRGAMEGRVPNQEFFLHRYENETRRLPADFSAVGYLTLNPELKSHLKKNWEPAFHYLRYGRWEGRKYKQNESIIFNEENLHRSLARIYDMPEVIIDDTRIPTVNVLVPAFDFGSMSAGFFGVFQVALFVRRCGLNVRLVMYDEFDFDASYMRSKLKNYPGLESLLDHVETVYIGDRKEPLRVSKDDNCIATVWYSAYLAQKIASYVSCKKFLYLIQDYETVFYASSSHFAVAEATYSFDYVALFSSKALQDFFLIKSIGAFNRDSTPRHAFFNNACSRSLDDKVDFLEKRRNQDIKRLAFYSRPVVNRNMFELGALALCEAYRQGMFPDQQWEFYGIGLGEATIQFHDGVELKQLPRMNLKDYQKLISTFDVGLCLMASSHPSLLPFDLAGSGAIVVTNSFGVKDQAYFDSLVNGVLVAEPNLHSIVKALGKAVIKCENIEERFDNASTMKFPTDWDQTFSTDHRTLISETFAKTYEASRDRTTNL